MGASTPTTREKTSPWPAVTTTEQWRSLAQIQRRLYSPHQSQLLLRGYWPAYTEDRGVAIVQLPSCVWLFVTLWTAAHQASLSLTTSWSLPKFMSIESVVTSSHLILWCPLLLLSSFFPSIRDFSSESAICIRWPKYYSFSFNISRAYYT